MSKKFLVADDSAMARKVLSKILKSRWPDATILEAENGHAAGVLVNTEQPELVLLDINMPGGVDGFQVIINIKTDFRKSKAKIITITGSEDPDAEFNMKSYGSDAFMKKPIVAEELLKIAANLLGEGEESESGDTSDILF